MISANLGPMTAAVTSTFCCCLGRRGDERGILDEDSEQTSIRRVLGCIRQHKGRRDLGDDGAVAVDDDHQEGGGDGRTGAVARGLIQLGTIIYDICTTASLSYLRTTLPESSSCPLPAKRPNDAT